jgi:hypothetical protein
MVSNQHCGLFAGPLAPVPGGQLGGQAGVDLLGDGPVRFAGGVLVDDQRRHAAVSHPGHQFLGARTGPRCQGVAGAPLIDLVHRATWTGSASGSLSISFSAVSQVVNAWPVFGSTHVSVASFQMGGWSRV